MTHITRRRRLGAAVVAIAAFAVLATGCAPQAAAPEASPSNTPYSGEVTPVSVALGFLPTVEFAGNFVADAEGYYAEVGIEASFVPGGPNAPAPEVAIASGEAQIAYESNTSRLFNYLTEEDDIVVIGRTFQTSPNGLLSLKDKPITSADDLTGSVIIAGAPNRSSLDALMAINDVTDWTFVPGGADIGALQGGQGDALLGFATNQPIALEQQGLKEDEDFYFTTFDKLDYHLLADAIIVSRPFLEENRDVVVNFLKATAKGWEKAMDDPSAAAELTTSTYAGEQGLNPEQQTAVLEAQIPFIRTDSSDEHGLFWLDPQFVQDKVYPSLEAGGATGLPDVATVIDETVQQDAQK
ncbi:ABC transporter substrate-binding protein [Microbacterium sp. ZW CA_36]|uniref:ABC transporter substrate-binding protein n=1 Tax=Microbacterium sp. ZW CA_36 TaxID=3378078 RepID=UPI0038522D06